jgi:RNA polymerase sigma-70 factor (ECF subfamily)
VTAQPLGRPEAGESDAELLREIASGSENAFKEFRSRYARAVAHVCRTIAGSDAEDCEQEVFVRVWHKAALFDPTRGSAAAWLLTVARRTALNLRTGARGPVPLEAEVEGTSGEPRQLEAFWLEAALARLSERERTVVELAYYHDLSESAIAKRLRVPIGSVKSWKRRGLNRLATLLGEESP